MYLYNLTLQKPTIIYQAITGNFISKTSIEILINKGGNILELLTLNEKADSLIPIISQETYSHIKKISSFKLIGNKLDYIILLTDSGRLIILQVINNKFKKVFQETFGKSGCRRIVPGTYIGIDPKGRSIMIGAIEKQKFVYIFNRNEDNNLTISSPLEAHKNNVIVYDICGLDNGYENPLYLSIEVEYNDEEDNENNKFIVYYEMELSLNYVVRKNLKKIDNSAYMLCPIIGNEKNGVIIFCENFFIYTDNNNDNNNDENNKKEKEIIRYYPQRYENIENKNKKNLLMINYTPHFKKKKYYLLTQSEFGDVYKINFHFENNDINNIYDITIEYFDTFPIANSICILFNYLFLATESGNHLLFIENSENKDKNNNNNNNNNKINFDINNIENNNNNNNNNNFYPKPNISNYIQIDSFMNLPILDSIITNEIYSSNYPQIFSILGRANQSYLKILNFGLSVNVIVDSNLPGNPIKVFSLKNEISDLFYSFIIVSFINATLLLEINDKIFESNKIQFEKNFETILVSQLIDNSYIQIIKNGIIHIKNKKNFYKASSEILFASANLQQIAIALKNNEILFFELDREEGKLLNPEIKYIDNEITYIELSPMNIYKKSKYLAIACKDLSIRILSLDFDNILNKISIQILNSEVNCIKFLNNININNNNNIVSENLDIFIGLKNGFLIKGSIDIITGNINNDMTMKYLGNKPVNIFNINNKNNLIIVGNTRPVFAYKENNNKLVYEIFNEVNFDYLCEFNNENINNGFIGIYNENLKICKFNKLTEKISENNSIKLRYTPKKILMNSNNYLIIIESDNHSMCKDEKISFNEELNKKYKNIYLNDNDNESSDLDLEENEEKKKNNNNDNKINEEKETKNEEKNTNYIEEFSQPFCPDGKWASLIRIFDPFQMETTDLIEFTQNEALISASLYKRKSINNENNENEIKTNKNEFIIEDELLLIGSIKNFTQTPHFNFTECSIYIFKFNNEGNKINFYIKQKVNDIPLAITQFENKLLCGIGNKLILYQIGKKNLLLKCESKKIPDQINKIITNGTRIIISTLKNSIYLIKHVLSLNQFYIICDDIFTRYIISIIFIDYDTIACCDKFENFFIYRIPKDCDIENENDPMGSVQKWENGFLRGATYKFELINNIHIGEVITYINKCNLNGEKDNVILYATISGRIGVFIPFETGEEFDFFTHLELVLRVEVDLLSGREHIIYRSMYGPVKGIIDGDLCEEFYMLEEGKKNVEKEIEENKEEIENRLNNMRNKIY